jgi:hypothetical protein
MNNTLPTRVTYQTVALAFIAQGLEAAKAQLSAPQCAKPHDVATKACVQLASMGAPAPELEALARSLAPANAGNGRGACSLELAGTKVYKAQQVGEDGDVWIRVPVSALGAIKGDRLVVVLKDHKIQITRE